MCNCVILDVTVKNILITAFLKKLPFLAKGLEEGHVCPGRYDETHLRFPTKDVLGARDVRFASLRVVLHGRSQLYLALIT